MNRTEEAELKLRLLLEHWKARAKKHEAAWRKAEAANASLRKEVIQARNAVTAEHIARARLEQELIALRQAKAVVIPRKSLWSKAVSLFQAPGTFEKER